MEAGAAEAAPNSNLAVTAGAGPKPTASSDDSGEQDHHNTASPQQAGDVPAAATGRKRTRPVRAIEEDDAPAPRATRHRKKPGNSHAKDDVPQQTNALPAVNNTPTIADVPTALAHIHTQPDLRTAQLEQALRDKDIEVMRLKQMLTAKQQEMQGQAAISEPELKQAYCHSVQSLKDYIAVSNLTSYDISGKNLPEKITNDIKTLVHTISKVCLQVLKPETPYVLDTVSKDITSTSQQDWELDKSHWIAVIAAMNLSNAQIMAILKAREQHLTKMQVLMAERASVARQAADVTMVASAQSSVVDSASSMSMLLQHGYLYFAHNALMLHKIMEMIKDSLLREQKLVMELFLKVLYQVLSPVQAAVFVVEAFPYHCDVLALANVLNMVFDKEQSGMMPSMSLSGAMSMDALDPVFAGPACMISESMMMQQQQQQHNQQQHALQALQRQQSQQAGLMHGARGMGGADPSCIGPFSAHAAVEAQQQAMLERQAAQQQQGQGQAGQQVPIQGPGQAGLGQQQGAGGASLQQGAQQAVSSHAQGPRLSGAGQGGVQSQQQQAIGMQLGSRMSAGDTGVNLRGAANSQSMASMGMNMGMGGSMGGGMAGGMGMDGSSLSMELAALQQQQQQQQQGGNGLSLHALRRGGGSGMQGMLGMHAQQSGVNGSMSMAMAMAGAGGSMDSSMGLPRGSLNGGLGGLGGLGSIGDGSGVGMGGLSHHSLAAMSMGGRTEGMVGMAGAPGKLGHNMGMAMGGGAAGMGRFPGMPNSAGMGRSNGPGPGAGGGNGLGMSGLSGLGGGPAPVINLQRPRVMQQ